jgi:hypothetical protein
MSARPKLINGLDCSYVTDLADVIDEVRIGSRGGSLLDCDGRLCRLSGKALSS